VCIYRSEDRRASERERERERRKRQGCSERHYDYHDHHCSHHSSSAGSQKSTNVPHQTLLIHCSANIFLTTLHIVSIAAFCFRIYRVGRRSNSLKVFIYLIILAVYITGVIMQGVIMQGVFS
jgi:hypothetical protein